MSNQFDFPQYTIKAVSNKTGIPAVTIRAWERRYQLLSPYRSENRYRLYTMRDIAILLWIKNEISKGIRVSHAVKKWLAFNDKEAVVDQLPVASEKSNSVPLTTPTTQDYATRIYQLLLRHDESQATKVFLEAVNNYMLVTIFEEVIRPCMIDIGEAWETGRIRISDEHLASNFLKGHLMSILQKYPNNRNDPKIIIGCAPNEYHELAILMLSILLRKEGYQVEFLGFDVPLDDLADYANDQKPAMVILSATLEETAYELGKFNNKLLHLENKPIFGYGGPIFVRKPELRNNIHGLYLGNTFQEALTTIKEII